MNKDLTKAEIFEKLKKDVILFGKTISPNMCSVPSPKFHYELGEFYHDREKTKICIQAPRGSAKSSLTAGTFPLHHIIFDEGHKLIVLGSKSLGHAQLLLDTIKNILEHSEPFKYLFGYYGVHSANTIKWNQDEIIFKLKRNGKTENIMITTRSASKQVVGLKYLDQRPTYICHEKGTSVWFDGRLTPIEETDWEILPEVSDKSLEISVYGVPGKEKVTFGHKYWAKKKVKWYDGNKRRHWKFEEAKWTRADELTKDHWIGSEIEYVETVPQPIKVYKNAGKQIIKNENGTIKGFTIDYDKEYANEVPDYFNDEEFWWAFGLWLGDGHVSKYKVEWSCAHKYPKIEEKLRNFIDKYNKSYSTPKQGCNVVGWNKVDLSRWLKTFYEGLSIKFPPEWVYNLPKKYLRQIVKGYIDSDGQVDYDKDQPKIRITSVNKEGLLKLQKILDILEIPSYVRETTSARWTNFGDRKCWVRQKYDIYFRNNVEQLGIIIKKSDRYAINPVFIEDGYSWKQVKSIQDGGIVTILPVNTPEHTYETPIGKSHNCWDDPEDSLNSKTAEAMDNNLKVLLKDVVPALDPLRGRVWVIGTPQNGACMVVKLQQYDTWFSKTYRSIINFETKEVLWKEWMPFEKLIADKQDKDRNGKGSWWMSEYQCEITGDEDQLFRAEDMQYWDGSINTENKTLTITHKYGYTQPRQAVEEKTIPVNFFMGVDPASSERATADFTTIVLIAYDADANIYVLPYFRKRAKPSVVRDKVVEYAQRFMPTRSGIETVQAQEVYRDGIKEKMMSMGLHLAGFNRTEGFKPRTEKNERLSSMEIFFADRKIFFMVGANEELIEEFLLHPRSKTDDLKDGLYYATRKLIKPDHNVEVYDTQITEEDMQYYIFNQIPDKNSRYVRA